MNYCTIDLLNIVILTKRFIGCFFFFCLSRIFFLLFTKKKTLHYIQSIDRNKELYKKKRKRGEKENREKE